jgi:hypothetical protein
VSAGATGARGARTGCRCAEAGAPRMSEILKASSMLPHWPWQPDDLQHVCLSVDLARGALVCDEPGDDELCIGHGSSWVALLAGAPDTGAAALAVAVVPAASVAIALACAVGEDVAAIIAACVIAPGAAACATPACSPTASWKARRANKTRARDRARTSAAYSISPLLSKRLARALSKSRGVSALAQYEPVRRPEERPPPP